MQARGPLIAGASGLAVATAFAFAAAALRVACDENLRLAGATEWAYVAWHWWPSFAVCGFGVGLVRGLLGAPRASRIVVALLPWLALAAHGLTCDAGPATLDPYTLGLILTAADLRFLAGYAVLAGAGSWTLYRRGVPATRNGALAGAAAALLLVGFTWQRAHSAVAGGVDPDRRVIVVGLDGLDWNQLRPRFERGELPNLENLVETGASGSLSTFRPTLSPLIWTTIATGQPPARHGITDFIEDGSGIPFTSNMRRVPAVWTLLGNAGIRVGVVGWWATWPAEAVNGEMVSSSSIPDRGTNKGTLLATLDRQTYPDALIDEIRPLIGPAIRDGRKVALDVLARTPMQPTGDMQQRRFVAGWVLGADRIFAGAAEWIAENDAPRFLAVYLSATDTFGHLFCENHNPDTLSCQMPISTAYEQTDRLVGRILAHATPDTTILLLSDHGFDLARGHSAKGQINGLAGVIAMNGPGIPAGGTIASASVYDIVPTILALFGQPIPENMPGRPLLSAFERDRIASLSLRHGPPQRPVPGAEREQPIPAASDEAVKERLRVLGYIE